MTLLWIPMNTVEYKICAIQCLRYLHNPFYVNYCSNTPNSVRTVRCILEEDIYNV